MLELARVEPVQKESFCSPDVGHTMVTLDKRTQSSIIWPSPPVAGRTSREGMMRIRALVGVMVAAAVAAPALLAATPGAGLLGYGGEAGTIQGQVAGEAAGALPFTGYDLGLIVLAAGLLLAVGFMVRRASRADG